MENRERIIQLSSGTLVVESDVELDPLTGFASRWNSKRGYLFISKVLGKHFPTRPSYMTRIHASLAERVRTHLKDGPTLIIGFAETATCLGYGVFEELGCQDSLYLHTTRYLTGDHILARFSESHSHAPAQFLHMPSKRVHQSIVHSARNVVLVDDEFTTGDTARNLISELKKINNVANYFGASLLDWTPAALKTGFPIVSLAKGQHRFIPGVRTQNDGIKSERRQPLLLRNAKSLYGRLGCDMIDLDIKAIDEIDIETAKKVLVLGTGEFMNIPYLLGRYLEGEGCDVYVQSTTRSPISIGNEIKSIISFKDNYGEDIDNFLYNVSGKKYDIVIICYETQSIPHGHDLVSKLSPVSSRIHQLFF